MDKVNDYRLHVGSCYDNDAVIIKDELLMFLNNIFAGKVRNILGVTMVQDIKDSEIINAGRIIQDMSPILLASEKAEWSQNIKWNFGSFKGIKVLHNHIYVEFELYKKDNSYENHTI